MKIDAKKTILALLLFLAFLPALALARMGEDDLELRVNGVKQGMLGAFPASGWVNTFPEAQREPTPLALQPTTMLFVDPARQGGLNPEEGSLQLNFAGSNFERQSLFCFADENFYPLYGMTLNEFHSEEGYVLTESDYVADWVFAERLFLDRAMHPKNNGKFEYVLAWRNGNIFISVNGVQITATVKNPEYFKNILRRTKYIVLGADPNMFDTNRAYHAMRTPLTKFRLHDSFDGWRYDNDKTPPEPVARIIAETPWGGEVKVSWTPSASTDVAKYEVYRNIGAAPAITGVPYQIVTPVELTDTDVITGNVYHYAVVAVDKAGNKSAPSDVVNATAIAGDGPKISAVSASPLDRPVRPGAVIAISLKGQYGGKAEALIAQLGKVVTLTEQNASGVYQGTFTVAAEDVKAVTTSYQLVGKLTDDLGSSTYAGPNLAIVGEDVLSDVTPPAVALVSHDAHTATGFSGKLVAGDILNVTMEGEAGGFASFKLSGITEAQKMTESEPGIYKGSYTIQWKENGQNVAVEATLADLAGNEARLVAEKPVNVDTRVTLTVTASDKLLPADKESKTRILIKAENANGGYVTGHELAVTLSTTEEYTGVVGGGKVEDKLASKDDVDDLEVKWGGVTDNFGETAATYTAGFAAKTALLIAKDLTTGDMGAGWLNTFVASTVSIQLLPVNAREAAQLASIRMSASPAWLTADGRSKSRIRAWLTDSEQKPIKGARMNFTVMTDNGSIKVLHGVTDATGMAEADYRAGTMSGLVTIATYAPDQRAASSITLELRSDAPAKIGIVSSAQSMPADGRSTSNIRAVVTDINDNPNESVPVAFSVVGGTGSVKGLAQLTDRKGAVAALYTAGRTAGTAVVEAKHTSRAPTADELRRIYGTIFVPRLMEDQDREKMKVSDWLVEAGDKVVKGQPVVRVVTHNGDWLLKAPETGVFVREVRHAKDVVELGDTVGYVEIDPEVWKDSYEK